MGYVTASNKYVKFAVSSQGCLGSHHDDQVGIQYDSTGNGVFSRNADYLHQGTPWQMFSLSSDKTWTAKNQNDNSDDMYFETDWGKIEPTVSTINAANGEYLITWGEATLVDSDHEMKLKHEYRISNDLKGIAVKTTIRAVTAFTGVKFATAIDPDPDGNQQIVSGYPAYLTRNIRGDETVVNGSPENWVCGNGIVTNNMLAIYSTSDIPHNTAVLNPWSTEPAQYLAGTSIPENGDFAIGMGFNIGDMEAGEEKVIEYFYMLEKPSSPVDETAPNVENLRIFAVVDNGDVGYEFSIVNDEDKQVLFHVKHGNTDGDVESVSELVNTYQIFNSGVSTQQGFHPTAVVFKGVMTDSSGNTSNEFKFTTPLSFIDNGVIRVFDQVKHSSSQNEDVVKVAPNGNLFGFRASKLTNEELVKLEILIKGV